MNFLLMPPRILIDKMSIMLESAELVECSDNRIDRGIWDLPFDADMVHMCQWHPAASKSFGFGYTNMLRMYEGHSLIKQTNSCTAKRVY